MPGEASGNADHNRGCGKMIFGTKAGGDYVRPGGTESMVYGLERGLR